MADLETKDRRHKRRKRNEMARSLRDNKGPFALKIVNPKKQEYKRVHLRPQDITSIEDGEDEE